MAVLAVLIFAFSFRLALGGVGRRLAALPLWILVGVQGFRLPLELAMHRMFERGIMPEQMSYSGRNLDIVTGITALIVAALCSPAAAGRRWSPPGTARLALSSTSWHPSCPPRRSLFARRLTCGYVSAVRVAAGRAGAERATGHMIIFRRRA